MLTMKRLLLVFISALTLVGCQKVKVMDGSYVPNMDKTIIVDGREFSIEEIQKGIKSTFNNVLYYRGNDNASNYLLSNKSLILNKELEYELYYERTSKNSVESIIYPPKIYITITNIYYPLPSTETSQQYEFGIDVNKFGLRSDFSYQGHSAKGEAYNFMTNKTEYLGKYSILIDEIKKPAHEEMDEQWRNRVEKAISLYMDRNDFYNDKNNNLEPGKYNIYVQRFFESDKDTTILFENENGNIYTGTYYFIHDVTGNNPADLNNVMLCEKTSESFRIYLERIRSDPAISMEYAVN